MNRIRCAKCGDLLHSEHRHDFVTCSCGAVSVDGGNDYSRYVGRQEDIIVVRDSGDEVPLADMTKEEE